MWCERPGLYVPYALMDRLRYISFVLQICCFIAARCCASAAYVVVRCLYVCLSVTFVNSVKTSNHIFKMFSPSGSQVILVFLYQTAWQYSDGNPPPPTGTFNAGRVGTGRDRESEPGFTACCQLCDPPVVINTAPPDHGPASCDTYRW